MKQRILRDTQATLQVTFYSGDTAQDADGAVTVSVTRADGTALATNAATTKPASTTGIYQYTLASQADLDDLTLVWSGAFGAVAQKITTYAEIVGGFYVSLADIRALDGLSDATKYPNAKLSDARKWFEDTAERVCKVAFVPRYGRELLDGDGCDTLMLKRNHVRRLLSVKIDGTVRTLSDFAAYENGKIVWNTGFFPVGATARNVEVAYEHGYDAPDGDLQDAALTAIRRRLMAPKSGVPENAISMATEVGTFSLALAGERRPTGMPDVDAVLLSRVEKIPLVG